MTKTGCKGWKLYLRALYGGGAPQPLIDTPPLPIPEGYPAFHSFLYTLDTFIPFADLPQEAYWTVTDDGPWGGRFFRVHRLGRGVVGDFCGGHVQLDPQKLKPASLARTPFRGYL